MQLDPTEDIRSRQQKGQAYTCKVRVEKTLRIIGAAIQAISSVGLRVTVAEVNRRTRLSRNTIQAYWSRLADQRSSHCEEGTVSLRDESIFKEASPQQLETLIPTQLTNTTAYSFDEIKAQNKDSKQAHMKAILYAIQQAKIGIIITGIPETLKRTILGEVDKWRQQESSIYHEQQTTQ